MRKKNWSENLKGEDHLEDGMIISEWILGKWGGKVWIRYIWFRIGTIGGLLRKR
jgi:hypothetical protein